MQLTHLRRLAPLAFLLALPLCSFAQKVKIEYDRSLDFRVYRKYAWKEHPFLKTHPDSRKFVVGSQLVQSDTNEILVAKGFQPVEVDPDFYVTHFITARLGSETHTVPVADLYPGAYMWPGAWYSWPGAYFPAWDTFVENYMEGILLLDIVDARTNRLIWRAACKDKIDDMKERHKNVEDTVKKALKSFPPRYSAKAKKQ
ncbi:MAG: DUF4136 domain-containing protein [Acidobacteria bacterium]|nr:DUF4136 domain-containing protein [Acidobacteriota bacterium]